MGRRLFRRFLEIGPENRAIFSFENPTADLDTLMKDPKAETHANVMFGTLSFCITKCDDMPMLMRKLTKLAGRHAGYGVKPHMYK